MEVYDHNNVKIYNLSTGKSLPEWLSDRKKRALQKKDVGVRKRIELIQDFEMPGVSNSVKVSNDGQYVLITGTYKPRIRCYEVKNLSMKFERCMDSDIVKFEILSEDYSKLVFLQCDRYVELHAQYGRYYRTRIPKFGRDMAYHTASCDLYFVGASNEVYRLNLDIGRYLNPLVTDASSINVCRFNPQHQLFVCGTSEGRVEAWDPRTRTRVGLLDCALSSVTEDTEVHGMPSVTSLSFKDGLLMAVGTGTGQILLYDIRSSKPVLVKDHLYGLPIKNVEFHSSGDLVLSMDKKILKIWEEKTGKAFTSIEPPSNLNDLCLVPQTGMLFMANEDKKVLTYYLPALGPAPKWCGFLDNLVEELEENTADTLYEDYKFVTKKELDELGLSHLIGSNLLRAYMHGYFMDIRLYRKAKALVEPFVHENYIKKKVSEKIEEERANRVKLQTLPKINKDLALKYMEQQEGNKKQQQQQQETGTYGIDDRFRALFENPEFQVDKNAEAYRMMNPIVSKMDRVREKRLKQQEKLKEQFEEVEEMEGRPSSEDDESSSDDDVALAKEMKKQYRMLKNERKVQQRLEDQKTELQPKFYALKQGEEFAGIAQNQKKKKQQQQNMSLAQRLEQEEPSDTIVKDSRNTIGNREMTFKLNKAKMREEAQKLAQQHSEERRKIVRSAKSLQKKLPPKFWMGKRVQ